MIITMMAAYNAENTILESIASFLESAKICKESHLNIDSILIIRNDGSKDKTNEKVINYIKENNIDNILFFENEKNLGILETREVMLNDVYLLVNFLNNIKKINKNKIMLSFLDSDDLYTNNALKIKYENLMNRDDLVAIGGQYVLFSEDLNDKKSIEKNYVIYKHYGLFCEYPISYEEVKVHSLFQTNSIMSNIAIKYEYIEKKKSQKIKIWTKNRIGEDWSWIVEQFEDHTFKFENLKDDLFFYRRHENQMTSNIKDGLYTDQARIREKMFSYLKLIPTKEEHLLHITISPCRHWGIENTNYFWENLNSIENKAKKWLNKIKSANKKTKFLSEEILNKYEKEILKEIKLKLNLVKNKKIKKDILNIFFDS